MVSANFKIEKNSVFARRKKRNTNWARNMSIKVNFFVKLTSRKKNKKFFATTVYIFLLRSKKNLPLFWLLQYRIHIVRHYIRSIILMNLKFSFLIILIFIPLFTLPNISPSILIYILVDAVIVDFMVFRLSRD